MSTIHHIRTIAIFVAILLLNAYGAEAQEAEYVDYNDAEAAGTVDAAGVVDSAGEGELSVSVDSADDSVSDRTKRDLWEWGALRHHSNLTGTTGLLHMAEAGSGETGTFGVGVHTWYFKYSDYLIDGDENAAMWGGLNLRVTPLDFLEIHYGITTFANSNNKEYPSLFQALGDMDLGVKGYFSPINWVTLGLDVSLYMLNSVGEVSLDWSGTSVSFDMLATFDFSKLDDNVPIRGHLKVGYIFDNASNLLTDFEKKNGGCGVDKDGDGNVEYEGCLSPVERFALQIDRNDQFRIGVGIDALLPYVSPMLEYGMEIPVNRQDFICPQNIPGDYDSCMLNEKGAGIRQVLTIGARILPPIKDLAIDLGLDIGLSGYAPTVHELAAEAPYRLIFGLSYNFDPFPEELPPPPLPPEPVVELPPPPLAVIAGMVHDEASAVTAIPGAVISYAATDLNPQVADKDGRFKSYEFPAGTITIAVSADGYNDATFTVEIPDTGIVEQKFPLKAVPKKGVVEVYIIDGEDNPLAGVSVNVAGPTTDSFTTGSDGKFEFETDAGKHKLSASKEGFMSKRMKVDAEVDTKTKVQIQLRAKPKKSLIVVKKNKIRIKRKIHFEVDSDVIKSNSFALLDEIADLLINNAEIKLVQVQGHTDNRGKREYNVDLSERRARSVKSYLVEAGVERGRLEYKGFGPGKPVSPNVTRRGRARNRRVEFHILERDE